ncbi:MAG: YHS domain-containing protein [Gammaproteobacteria bacterium]|nr:YHS domain-containing protein [Gammaproteobacteria bacterium]
MNKILKLIALIGLSAFALQALSLDFVYTKKAWFGAGSEGNEYAIEGYDAVNYFTQNESVEGSADFAFKYKDKQWHFKNASNLALFKAHPEKYAPQYGGHCAWRMGIDGEGVYGDPTLWAIVDDKLYLNYNKETKNRWEKDIPGFIIKADQFWLGKNKFKTLN